MRKQWLFPIGKQKYKIEKQSQNQIHKRSKQSEGSKCITHYLGDKNRFDVSSEGPSSGISVGGSGKARVFLYK